MSGQVQDIRIGFAQAFDDEIVRRGWTNDEMARFLRTSERQVRRWRRGETEPALRTYRSIRIQLGWVGGDNDEPPARAAA
jgi:ribosome-binding protein aMBF1 (putative translation factor)